MNSILARIREGLDGNVGFCPTLLSLPHNTCSCVYLQILDGTIYSLTKYCPSLHCTVLKENAQTLTVEVLQKIGSSCLIKQKSWKAEIFGLKFCLRKDFNLFQFCNFIVHYLVQIFELGFFTSISPKLKKKLLLCLFMQAHLGKL